MIFSETIDVLIIDDNPAEISELKLSIEKMGISSLLVASNEKTAHDLIERNNPRVIICNLFLDNKPTGFDLVRKFSDQSGRFVIVTNSISELYYEEMKEMNVGGYLIKPFHYLTLQSVTEHILTIQTPPVAPQISSLFMRVASNKQIRIDFNEILYLYSERNYIFVKTIEKLYTIKRSLKQMQDKLDNRFVRIHNSYIINTDHLKSISPSVVLVQKDILPLGRAYKKNLTLKVNRTKPKEVL